MSSSSSSSRSQERPSSKTLEEVGVEAVLSAMHAQKRASQPAPSELHDERDPDAVHYDETPRSQRVPADSDAFLKAR